MSRNIIATLYSIMKLIDSILKTILACQLVSNKSNKLVENEKDFTLILPTTYDIFCRQSRSFAGVLAVNSI